MKSFYGQKTDDELNAALTALKAHRNNLDYSDAIGVASVMRNVDMQINDIQVELLAREMRK
jgi:hypothetical protein